MSIRNYYLIVTFFLASFAYAETFSGWQSTHFTAAQIGQSTVSGVEADPDRDGLTNLLEYAYASDPWKAETGMLPVFGQSQNHLTLQYRRLRTAADLFMDVQATDDLAALWTFPDNVASSTDSSHTNYDLITLTDPQTVGSNDHRFLRLTVAIDSDQDGLPDDWEMRFFGNLDQLAGGDEDFDLLTNLMEYRRGSNPTDFFNGETPVLTLTGGDAQTGFAGNDLALPLTVTVKHRDGTTVWPNAPVVFTTTSGGSFNYTASPATVTANSAGIASVTHTLPATAGTSNITATAGKTPNTSSVTFHETASGLPPDLGPITAEGTGTDIVIGWKTTPAASGYTVQTFNSTTQQWTTVSSVSGDVSTFTDTNPNLQPGIIALYKVLGNDGTSLHAESAVEGGVKNPAENNDTDLLTNGEEVAAGSYSKERAQSLLATGNLAFGANPAGWMGPDPKLPDTDADGVLDNQDGWANDPDYSPPRLPDTHYAVINLDEWGLGADDSIAFLNDNLQVAGYANAEGKLFRWKAGQRTLLDLPLLDPDIGYFYLMDMNNSGAIIGNAGNILPGSNLSKGVLWAVDTSSYSFLQLAVPSFSNGISLVENGYSATTLLDINDGGQIVGQSSAWVKREIPRNGVTIGYDGSYVVSALWTGGQPALLGGVTFSPAGTAEGQFPEPTERVFNPVQINNSGWMLGDYADEAKPFSQTRPVLRDPSTGAKTVISSVGVYAMDDASPPHCVGTSGTTFLTAAVWEKGASSSWQAKDLFRGQFERINNRGEMLASYLSVKGVRPYGYTLVKNLQPVDINQSLPPGWSGANIVQINNQGIIAGTATYKDPANPTAQATYNNVLAVPVEIEVKKKGTTAAPVDGLLVKKGDILEFKLTNTPQQDYIISKENIVWYFQQLKLDGTYTTWTAFGENGKGVKFEHTTTEGGIFQVKAVLMGQQANAVFFNRKKDEIKSIPSNPKFKYGDGIKGQPDAIGIVDSDIQLQVCAQVKAALGTRLYASADTVAAHGKFQAVSPDVHCNIFVAHKEDDGGAIVPLINGYLPPYDPPLANQWSGTQITRETGYEGQELNVALDRWRLLPANAFPQPGYVIAHPSPLGSPRGSGHTGIISYDGYPAAAGPIYVTKVHAHSLFNVSSRLRAYDPNFHDTYVAGWIP